MSLGIEQHLQVPMSTIPEKGSMTSRVHLTFYSDINSVVGAYHYLVPAGVGNKARQAWTTRLGSIRTISLSLVKSSPSSIKGGALPPTEGDRFQLIRVP